MIILIIQGVSLCFLIAAVVLWGFNFPHPSPLIRRRLPPRARWPEAQIRKWLRTGSFQRGFLNYFYRDPERVPPPGRDILAPADGLVTSVEVNEGIRYVVIALSFWDMHVQRSPVSGKVTAIERSGDMYMDGEGRQFAFLREKSRPVQTRIVFSTDIGKLAVRLITSLAARRIEVWPHIDAVVTRGQRIGRILLGSTVVLELPPAYPLRAQVGDRVVAGESVVAEPKPDIVTP